MSYTATNIIEIAQRELLDPDDDAYNDASGQPMFAFLNEGQKRFASETHCCQAVVDISVTAQTITYAAIVTAINAITGLSAEGVLFVSKVIPDIESKQVPLPKAPVSEMKALLASTVTTPTRYSCFAEAIRFDTHPDTTLDFTATVYCSFIPTDLSVVGDSILIPDEWMMGLVRYVQYCCRVTDRDAGLANGTYEEYETIKEAAARVFIAQIEKVPGAP